MPSSFIFFINKCSFFVTPFANFTIFSAFSGCIITKPSWSPTTISPGDTTFPPIDIGVLISPGPFLNGPFGVMPFVYIGNTLSFKASASLILPLTTIPPIPLDSHYETISFPNIALSVCPPASIMIISPGLAISIAL